MSCRRADFGLNCRSARLLEKAEVQPAEPPLPKLCLWQGKSGTLWSRMGIQIKTLEDHETSDPHEISGLAEISTLPSQKVEALPCFCLKCRKCRCLKRGRWLNKKFLTSLAAAPFFPSYHQINNTSQTSVWPYWVPAESDKKAGLTKGAAGPANMCWAGMGRTCLGVDSVCSAKIENSV